MHEFKKFKITRDGLLEGFVVHLDGLDFSGQLTRSESDDHAGLDDTCLYSANRYSTNTAYLVDILEGQTKSLIGRTRRW